MRKLMEKDRERLMMYITREPEMNLFFLGDLENFGFDNQEVSFYVHEKEAGWDFVILRYMENYILYSQNSSYDVAAAYAFLKNEEVDCISGKYELIQPLEQFFPQKENQKTYLSCCKEVKYSNDLKLRDGLILKSLSIDSFEELFALYLKIEEFKKTYHGEGKKEKAKESLLLSLLHGGLVLGAYEDGKLIAVAEATATNSLGAMLVGVATDPDFRQRGLATYVVKSLCEEIFKQNKKFLCLFYDNPKAGNIYKKIGFEEIGFYSLFR